jgi:hypothetical protein
MVQRSTEDRPSEILIIAPKEPPKPSKSEISRVMAEMGRRGGQIGGKRRLETMTEEQRRKAATKAAKARWKKPR